MPSLVQIVNVSLFLSMNHHHHCNQGESKQAPDDDMVKGQMFPEYILRIHSALLSLSRVKAVH